MKIPRVSFEQRAFCRDIRDNRAVAIDPRLAEAQRGQSNTYPDREKEVGRMLLVSRRVDTRRGGGGGGGGG